MSRFALFIYLVLFGIPVIAQNDVRVEQLDSNSFQLVFSSSTVYDVEIIQEMLMPVANSICAGLVPEFGHYRFESTESVGPRAENDTPDRIELVQQLSCGDDTSSRAPASRAAQVLSDSEKRFVDEKVRLLSEEYLSKSFSGEYSKAYDSFSEEFQSFHSFDEWMVNREKIRVDGGDLISLSIVQITIYENPPNAPRPGLYVAADYQNVLEKAPYHCGFLIWYKSGESEFEITREEFGLITDETLATVDDKYLQRLLDQMLCKAR